MQRNHISNGFGFFGVSASASLISRKEQEARNKKPEERRMLSQKVSAGSDKLSH